MKRTYKWVTIQSLSMKIRFSLKTHFWHRLKKNVCCGDLIFLKSVLYIFIYIIYIFIYTHTHWVLHIPPGRKIALPFVLFFQCKLYIPDEEKTTAARGVEERKGHIQKKKKKKKKRIMCEMILDPQISAEVPRSCVWSTTHVNVCQDIQNVTACLQLCKGPSH